MTSINLPKGYLSYSQINKYIMCPKSYKYYYIDQIPYKLNERLIIGSSVSWGLFQYNTNKAKGTQVDPLKSIETYITESFDVSQNNELDIVSINNMSKMCVNSYIKYLEDNQLDRYGVVSAEESKTYTLNGIDILYIPDLVKMDLDTMNVEIVDYKTARQSKSWSEDKIKYDIQTSIYALGEQENSVSIHEISKPKILKTKTVEPLINICKHKKTEQELEDSIEIITFVANSISRGDFPRCNPNVWNCSEQWCDYWHLCRGKK